MANTKFALMGSEMVEMTVDMMVDEMEKPKEFLWVAWTAAAMAKKMVQSMVETTGLKSVQ